MKKFLRITALVLALSCIFPFAAQAEATSIISFGADLTPEQRTSMMSLLAPTPGEVSRVVTVTNQEERDLLGTFIPAEQIGTRSISSSSVTLREKEAGITVATHNITWVSAAMVKSALITAGITDADVIVAAPFEVSGTAALAGILKAYESAVGETLGALAKSVAGEELAVAGQLGELLGQEEAASLISQLKEEVVRQGLDSPEKLRPAIEQGAKELGVTLTDGQIDILTTLMLKIIELDLDPKQLAEQVSSIAKTLQKLEKAQESTNFFIQKVKSGWDSVVSWFQGLFVK